MENEKQAAQDPYIKTDKVKYTLGDTILVRGLRKIPKPSYGLDGKFLKKEFSLMMTLNKEKDRSSTGHISCDMILEKTKKNEVKGKHGDWLPHNMTVTKHEIYDDGTFEFDIVVLNNYEAGTYYVEMWQSEEDPRKVFDDIKSQLFKIVGVA